MLESMGLPSKVDTKGGEGGAVTWDEEALNKMSKFAKGGAGDKRCGRENIGCFNSYLYISSL